MHKQDPGGIGMKKLLFILLPLLFISCSFSDNDSITFKNDSSYDVQLKLSNNLYDLKQGDSITVKLKTTDSKTVKNNNRVILKFLYRDYYSVIDKSFDTISVFNSSTHDIILYEKNDYIGTYEEITQSKEKFGIIIAAGQTKSFILYTKSPVYEAYYKDNNMPANLSFLSFMKQ